MYLQMMQMTTACLE
jgi:hypothetical protein